MNRPNWHQYFIEIASQVSKRSTCDRLSVGSILVRDKNILGSGFNGAPRFLDHCDSNNHLMKDGDKNCRNVVHSEINCIAMAARQGINVDGSTLYVSHYPCWECFKVLINCGIKDVYYLNDYRNSDLVKETAIKLNIPITKVTLDV